jgi:hypothetical protein
MTRKETLEYVRSALKLYKTINLHGREPDPIGWIALKLSCDRSQAEKLIAKSKEEPIQ